MDSRPNFNGGFVALGPWRTICNFRLFEIKFGSTLHKLKFPSLICVDPYILHLLRPNLTFGQSLTDYDESQESLFITRLVHRTELRPYNQSRAVINCNMFAKDTGEQQYFDFGFS